MAAAAAAPSSRRGECYAVIDLKKTAAMSNLQKALPRDDGTSRKTRHNSTDLPLWEGKKGDRERVTGMPGIKMFRKESFGGVFLPPLSWSDIFSFSTLIPTAAWWNSNCWAKHWAFIYLFFSHFVWEGWEMIVNYLSYGYYMVFGSCLAFGPKNWVKKKNLIQETICSVSKCLNPLFFYVICQFMVCWLFKGMHHPKMKASNLLDNKNIYIFWVI